MRVEVNVQDYSPQAPGCLPQLIHRVLEHPFLYSCWLLSFLAFRDSLFQDGAAAFFCFTTSGSQVLGTFPVITSHAKAAEDADPRDSEKGIMDPWDS